MRVNELKPTGWSCRQPSQNRLRSARTNVRFAAACGGALSSGPASTRTAATCHACRPACEASWPRTQRTNAPQSVSRRASAAARAMQLQAATDGERRGCANACIAEQCRVTSGRCQAAQAAKHTCAHNALGETSSCVTSSCRPSPGVREQERPSARRLLARRARRVCARRRKAGRRERARRGHPGAEARRRHCAQGKARQHVQSHGTAKHSQGTHFQERTRVEACQGGSPAEALCRCRARQRARRTSAKQRVVHALPGGGMNGGGGMPMGGRMPGGMLGPPICGGAEICARSRRELAQVDCPSMVAREARKGSAARAPAPQRARRGIRGFWRGNQTRAGFSHLRAHRRSSRPAKAAHGASEARRHLAWHGRGHAAASRLAAARSSLRASTQVRVRAAKSAHALTLETPSPAQPRRTHELQRARRETARKVCPTRVLVHSGAAVRREEPAGHKCPGAAPELRRACRGGRPSAAGPPRSC